MTIGSNQSFHEESGTIRISSDDAMLLNRSVPEKARARSKANEIRLKYFAMALAKSLRDPRVCQLLKSTIATKPDGYTEVLWKTIRTDLVGKVPLTRFIANQLGTEAKRSVAPGMVFAHIPLLNIACGHLNQWDGRSPILVIPVPLTVDDIECKTVVGYDADLNERTLDAQKMPDVPFLVVGINEVVDPQTGKPRKQGIIRVDGKPVQISSLRKTNSATAFNGQPVYFEWFRTSDDYEGFFNQINGAEFKVLILTDLGKSITLYWTGIYEDTWYHMRQFFTNYYTELGQFLSVKIYEIDDNNFDFTAQLEIQKYGATVGASWNLDNSDEEVGDNQLIDLHGGPLYTDRNTTPVLSESYPCGAVRFTFWWSYQQNYTISYFPYIHQYTTTSQSNNWDTQGGPDGKDVCYLLDLESQANVDITTCFSGTDFPTMLEIWDRYGRTGTYSFDDCQYQSGTEDAYSTAQLSGIDLPAGLYYLIVDGYEEAEGNYTLRVTKN